MRLDFGMLLNELRDERSHEAASEFAWRTDAEPAFDGAQLCGCFRLRFCDVGNDFLAAIVKQRTFFGELERSGRAGDETDGEARFQGAERPAHGRWGRVQGAGGCREIAGPDDLDKKL